MNNSVPTPTTSVEVLPEQEITITLQAQYWQIVMNAVQELPFRVANPVVQALTQQFSKTLADQPASLSRGGNGIDNEIPKA